MVQTMTLAVIALILFGIIMTVWNITLHAQLKETQNNVTIHIERAQMKANETKHAQDCTRAAKLQADEWQKQFVEQKRANEALVHKIAELEQAMIGYGVERAKKRKRA
jgi:competence protein ComGC